MGSGFDGIPVTYSPSVPPGHMLIIGQREQVVFHIPPKPKRRWWQRQRTVDARHAQAVAQSKRDVSHLFARPPIPTRSR